MTIYGKLLYDDIVIYEKVMDAGWVFEAGGVSVAVDRASLISKPRHEVVQDTFDHLLAVWLDSFCDPARWVAAGRLITNRGQA